MKNTWERRFFVLSAGGTLYWFKEGRNRDKVPRVRVVVARHMRESDFRRVAPPPPALPNALVDELSRNAKKELSDGEGS